MTLLAGGRKPLVRRTVGIVVIGLVTGNASGRGQVEIIVDVTIGARAWRNRVPASQWEPDRVVIEPGIQPVIGGMALVAGSGVSEGHVIGCLGLLEVRRMARITGCGHDLKPAVGRILVTGIAIDCGVRAGQGKAIVVLLNVLDRDLPPAHAVALLAIRA